MTEESLGTFGEVEDEEADLAYLDEEPIPFTLVGYEIERTNAKGEPDPKGTRKKQEFVFHVRPKASSGALVGMLQQVDIKGKINERTAAQFMFHALVPADQDRWLTTMEIGSIDFHGKMLVDLAEALSVRYGLRPSQPRSTRRAGPRRSGTTSKAGSSAKKSTSRRSPARKP